MQKKVSDGIMLCCDFCGTEWDQIKPMIEGHKGSIICLECLKEALVSEGAGDGEFACTLCVETKPAEMLKWRPADLPSAANPKAVICKPCVRQAAGAFSKDPDVDWKNKLG